MNAIDLLKKQHAKMRAALEDMCRGDLDTREMRRAADEVVAHMVIEEHVFYPRVRELMRTRVEESFEEHTVARFALARALTGGTAEKKKARAVVLMDLMEHHLEEEENEMFPKVKRSIPNEELERLGTRMQHMYEKAVEMGLDALVKGTEQELRSLGAAMDGGARRHTSGRRMGAPRH